MERLKFDHSKFDDSEVDEILAKKDLAKFHIQSWFFICSRSLEYSSDGSPLQAFTLFFDPLTGDYVFRVFSRVHHKGKVGTIEELQGVLIDCFFSHRPCYGVKDSNSLEFSSECSKFLVDGAADKCSACWQQSGGECIGSGISGGGGVLDIKLETVCEPTIYTPDVMDDMYEDSKDVNELEYALEENNLPVTKEDDIINQVLEAKMEVEEEKKLKCDYCEKEFRLSLSFGSHLLTMHSEEPGMLKKWFAIKGNPERKSEMLHSISIGTRGTKIDWETEKTSEMEDMMAQYKPKKHELRIRKRNPKMKEPIDDFGYLINPREMRRQRKIMQELNSGEKEKSKYPPGPKDCELCGRTVPTYRTMYAHMKSHHARSVKYSCQHCTTKIYFPDRLAEHILNCNPSAPTEARCICCHFFIPFPRDNVFAFKEHVMECIRQKVRRKNRRHKANMPPCDVCGKVFICLGTKRRHMVVEHGEEAPFKCDHPSCEFWTVSAPQLKAHQKTHLRDAGKASIKDFTTCHICGKKIFGHLTSSRVSAHLKTHQDIDYDCPEKDCDFTSKYYQALNRHRVRVHSTDPKYQCSICGIKMNPQRLKRHIEETHGEAKYGCDVCGKMLKSAEGLKTHMRIHTGENPFSCKLCDYTCKSSATKSLHMKFVHNGGEKLTERPINLTKEQMISLPKARYTPGKKLPVNEILE